MKKGLGIINSNQKAWLKPYIDMNTYQWKKATKKTLFYVNEYCSFWRNYEKCEKTEISNLKLKEERII